MTKLGQSIRCFGITLSVALALFSIWPVADAAQAPRGAQQRLREREVRYQPPTTVTLSPVHFRTASSQKIKKGAEFFITGDPYVPTPPTNALFSGYLHDTNGKDDMGESYDYRNEFYRAGLHFDVSKLVGHKVAKAVLSLRIFRTHHRGVHSNPDYYDHVSTCGTVIATGKSQWWTYSDQIDFGPPTVQVLPSTTSDLKIDVTEIVRSWVAGPDSNFGLVIMGDNEDLGAYTETICQTQYVHSDPGGDGAPTLTIDYY